MELDKIFILIFLIIGAGILIMSIWNFKALNHLKKNSKAKDEQLNDAKYYELKYKFEFLKATGSIIIGVLVFAGYNSFQNIKDTLKKDYEDKIASTDARFTNQIQDQQKQLESLNSEINKSKSEVLLNKKDVDQIRLKLTSSKESVIGFQSALTELEAKLSTVTSKEILRQRLYLVKDVPYSHVNTEWIYEKYYFTDYKTINGESLPKFKEPPIIIPFTNNGLVFTLKNINELSFEAIISNNTIAGELPRKTTFSLLISVIE
jgi:hypothetical protein